MTEAFASLFARAQLGDRVARDTVYKLAFHRLRGIASALLGRERRGHTLQPTALVSELFLKLHKLETQILNEDHFFHISARAMRQVLIDHARVKKPVSLAPADVISQLLPAGNAAGQTEVSIAVKVVFEKLRSMDSTVAETLWLRSVEGFTVDEISRSQNREPWRIRADYDFGLQWMVNRLKR
jgi:RNA polymerase sigma factor (TIGR02999 family)